MHREMELMKTPEEMAEEYVSEKCGRDYLADDANNNAIDFSASSLLAAYVAGYRAAQSTNGGTPAEEIALLNQKIEELEKESKRLIGELAIETHRLVSLQGLYEDAKEQGAKKMATAIWNDCLSPFQYRDWDKWDRKTMQLYKESQK
jgi:hypothetical protein